MSKLTHPNFPQEVTEKCAVDEIIPRLGFVGKNDVHLREFDGIQFSIGTWIGCYMLSRDGRVEKNTATPPHETLVFSPTSPIELMATIYRLWTEVFGDREPQDSCLRLGKQWLDYQGELKRLIPPPPTLWAEREFLRHSLNYIDKQHDWAEEDYLVKFSSLPGQLRIVAKETELFCPARGNWIGEVSISAKELFRNLTKRFIGPAVMLQIEADKLRIDNRVLRAKWGEP
ncbi:MAG: hypothetical protein WBB96_15075 [Candidatus Dechloromonas phosphoritropha]|jgi:hypothetical protein|nr:hypothetical protein [Candidatus Dechloromonas phosphoritropha]MBP8787315.1 hypothetical protein [Azonexus sp.]MBP9227624.1 hypothetical protein [Azonexus sp.]